MAEHPYMQALGIAAKMDNEKLATAQRLGIKPEEVVDYQNNTLLGQAIKAFGFKPPVQDRYEDQGLLDKGFWMSDKYNAVTNSNDRVPFWETEWKPAKK